MSCLSSAYREATKRHIGSNYPIKGIEKLRIDDPNANREWTDAEFETVFAATLHHLIGPFTIARNISLLGQGIVNLRRNDHQIHVRLGRFFIHEANKNAERNFVKVRGPLAKFLDSIDRDIACLISLARPWNTEY